MGPLLTEKDLQHEQLTEEDKRFIRHVEKQFATYGPDADTAGPITRETFAEAVKAIHGLCNDLEKLDAAVEAYEESQVERGHHPVHREPISGKPD